MNIKLFKEFLNESKNTIQYGDYEDKENISFKHISGKGNASLNYENIEYDYSEFFNDYPQYTECYHLHDMWNENIKGLGQTIMNDIIKFSKKYNLPITCQPIAKSKRYVSFDNKEEWSKWKHEQDIGQEKLVLWYSKNGFIDKGNYWVYLPSR